MESTNIEKFRKLGLSEQILKVIEEQKFEEPTEIQEKSIPLVLEGKDVTARSATGSGKTLAFGAGIIQNVESGKGIQALVLTPTRELAEQEAQSLDLFSKYSPLNILAVYGGVSINPQINALVDAEVVVGTPGRILDHLERRTLKLGNVKILVLDEADRMLDMGFIDDVKKIINYCPKERQTLLFSATITPDIAHLISRFMKSPIEVGAEYYVDEKNLTQVYYDVSAPLKFSLLVHLLENEKSNLVMVFCNTQKNTDFIAKNLKFQGINALAIHGGFSQDKRTRTMKMFNAKQIQVLVCTDVAARGLDIEGVSHVYNYDIPKDSKDYIHRVGRTARAGKDGRAISLVSSRDYDNFSNVLQDDELKIENVKLPDFKPVRIRWMPSERSSRGFRGSGRGGFRRGSGGGGKFGRFGRGGGYGRDSRRGDGRGGNFRRSGSSKGNSRGQDGGRRGFGGRRGGRGFGRRRY